VQVRAQTHSANAYRARAHKKSFKWGNSLMNNCLNLNSLMPLLLLMLLCNMFNTGSSNNCCCGDAGLFGASGGNGCC